MTIQEFCNLYKEGKIENLKEALEVKNYLPFAQKYELCLSVLNLCNDVDEQTGLVTVNNVDRHIIFITAMLSTYTNLQFIVDENTEINSIDEYDMLCENGLLDIIIKLFAEEYSRCEEMLMIMQNDLIANHNTLHNIVGNLARQLLSIAEPLSNTFKNKLDSFNLDLSRDDIDKYAKIFETIKK